MFCEETLISILPKGKLKVRPIAAPITESPIYFTRYNPRILKLPMPIAFMTPISRNSSESVKEIVKRKTTNAVIIRIMLTISRIPTTIMSKTYKYFIRALSIVRTLFSTIALICGRTFSISEEWI